MQNLTKLGSKLLLASLVITNPLHACDEHENNCTQRIYSLNRVEISPLPTNVTNLKVDCPGTQSLGGSIWTTNHEDSTYLPLPVTYVIDHAGVAVRDLTTESGKRKLDIHDLQVVVNERVNSPCTTITMKGVFDALLSGDYEDGTDTMVIEYFNTKLIKVSYKRSSNY
jgi:hypothetical protein